MDTSIGWLGVKIMEAKDITIIDYQQMLDNARQEARKEVVEWLDNRIAGKRLLKSKQGQAKLKSWGL